MLSRLMRVLLFAQILIVCSGGTASADKLVDFNIPAQRADVGLKLFAQQAETQFLFPYDVAGQYVVNSVYGIYTPAVALELLLKGTGLRAVYSQHGDLTIQADSLDSGDIMVKKAGVISTLAVTVMTGVVAGQPVAAQDTSKGNTLEEIIVTAQRREQSLQDVPISMDVVSGESLDKQGYTFLRDLADFTPGIIIKNAFEENGLMIRGNGNTGKNLSTEQAAPIFVDGIFFGLASQTLNAFLDVDRVEVLKGPQPVYFGQSAIAGAISITSRKPGPEWQGRSVIEYGRNNTQKIEAALGGPVTDTIGIRIAARINQTDGYLEDIFTGDNFPFEQEKGARVILQWTPTEKLEATAKLGYADQNMGTQALSLACGKFPIDTRRGSSVPFTGLSGYSFKPIDCSTAEMGKFTDLGVKGGPLFAAAPASITIAQQNAVGIIDMTQLRAGDLGPYDDPLFFDNPPVEFIDADFGEKRESEPWNTSLNLNYTLDNEVVLTSLTGFNRQVYQTIWEPHAPLLMNHIRWHTDYNSWSQEFRATSASGGTFEWMAGAYWQITEADFAADAWRADAPSAFRGSRTFEDNEWRTAFATLTYNFLGDKASLDLGGRYSDIHKEAISYVHEADWLLYHPVTGAIVAPGRVNLIPLGLHTARAAGRTAFRLLRVPQADIDHGKFNPQVVLRYRLNENLSLYGKWATGFKAGAFEVGGAQPPEGDAFVFGAETAMIWEAGARGSFWDGRAIANMTLFWTNYEDLQVTSVLEINNVTSARTSNAAKQRSRGAELSGRLLLSDRTSVGYSMSLLDSVMLDYTTATCQRVEQDRGLCGRNNTIDRSGEESIQAPDWQISFSLDHWIPVFESHKVSMNANFIASDDYITDRNWAKEYTMHDSQDLNLSLGYGDLEDVWQVTLWARNILEKRPTYNPENDFTNQGQISIVTNSSMFTTYGLQFRYNYN
jgi:iron complex outermembrane recepter protein